MSTKAMLIATLFLTIQMSGAEAPVDGERKDESGLSTYNLVAAFRETTKLAHVYPEIRAIQWRDNNRVVTIGLKGHQMRRTLMHEYYVQEKKEIKRWGGLQGVEPLETKIRDRIEVAKGSQSPDLSKNTLLVTRSPDTFQINYRDAINTYYRFPLSQKPLLISFNASRTYAVLKQSGLYIGDASQEKQLDAVDCTENKKGYFDVDWNPSDDNQLAVTNGEWVRIWNVNQQISEQLNIPPIPPPKEHLDATSSLGHITALRWSPKGKKLAVGCYDVLRTKAEWAMENDQFVENKIARLLIYGPTEEQSTSNEPSQAKSNSDCSIQ